MDDIAKVCAVLCKSGKFETGEGTCAPICLGQLGSARRNCLHRERVFGALANDIVLALAQGGE